MAAVVWNNPIFIGHFFVPSNAQIIFDNTCADAAAGIQGYAILAFLAVVANPESARFGLPLAFPLTFLAFRVVVNIASPSVFPDRIATMTTKPMLGFALAFLGLFVCFAVRAALTRPEYFEVRLEMYLAVFALWILFWASLLIVEFLPFFGAVEPTAFRQILPSAFVNGFAVWIVFLHSQQRKAEREYAAPGVGNEDENPFDFEDVGRRDAPHRSGFQWDMPS
jgi:hypothetical protein